MRASNQVERRGRGAKRAARAAGALALLVSLAGCNEHYFLAPSPSLRGITIPLPPPSFADEVTLRIDVSGTAPIGFDSPGSQAFLYERGTDRGYFVFVEDGDWTIEEVLVDLSNNCLETWVVDGASGDETPMVDYKVILREGDECLEDTSCSAQDMLGACLCLEKWSAGC